MKARFLFILLGLAGVLTAATCGAAAPKGATGACKDGSYTSAESKSGACSGHGGVKDWYAKEKAPAGNATAKGEAKAQAPKGSTGECKDGSYTSAESKQGACSGHGGVKDWHAKEAPEAAASKPSATAGSSAATPRPTARSETKSEESGASRGSSGPGKVWVNTSTKVYHCSGDRWYGKTEKGEYMSEADAKANGAHADRGKACN